MEKLTTKEAIDAEINSIGGLSTSASRINKLTDIIHQIRKDMQAEETEQLGAAVKKFGDAIDKKTKHIEFLDDQLSKKMANIDNLLAKNKTLQAEVDRLEGENINLKKQLYEKNHNGSGAGREEKSL
jgi:chromosome segregation ATPase